MIVKLQTVLENMDIKSGRIIHLRRHTKSLSEIPCAVVISESCRFLTIFSRSILAPKVREGKYFCKESSVRLKTASPCTSCSETDKHEGINISLSFRNHACGFKKSTGQTNIIIFIHDTNDAIQGNMHKISMQQHTLNSPTN